MRVYLLRHGIAEDGRPGKPDAERALTREGQEKLYRTLVFAKADLAPSLILTSPYRRARETAAIASEVLGYKGDVVLTSCLVPNSSPDAVWDEIRTHREEEGVLVVGHEPLFSSTAAYLLGAPEMLVDFKKGALIRMDLGSFGPLPSGILKWMLTAKLTA
ncbi:MAG: histidine phosphatase family protein [Bryobacteraceae bacterium]